ncbi:MAG: VOC family protein [Candidatus Omnitrophica bacterium]|nr:VOC family protein [Candidatus Omnitrophota bacterium]MBU1925654.1 VOC family protein [Candidatus Omnitrophota bacterium]
MSDNKKIGDHVGVLTNDAERLKNFYMKKLEFKFEKDVILKKTLAKKIFNVSSDFRFIRLYKGNFKLELFEPITTSLKHKKGVFGGFHHWGFFVNNRKKYCEKLKRQKVKVIEIVKKDQITYFIEDPDGNLIEMRD